MRGKRTAEMVGDLTEAQRQWTLHCLKTHYSLISVTRVRFTNALNMGKVCRTAAIALYLWSLFMQFSRLSGETKNRNGNV